MPQWLYRPIRDRRRRRPGTGENARVSLQHRKGSDLAGENPRTRADIIRMFMRPQRVLPAPAAAL